MYTVALAGRPNVGKSTLFNRLVGRKIALVDDQPGVTRDYREADASIYNEEFRLIDTAGFDKSKNNDLINRIQGQTDAALGLADIIIFMTDGREGILPEDKAIAKQLRCLKKPIILVSNKAETKLSDIMAHESYALGMGEPILISAEHNIGMYDLADAITTAKKKLGIEDIDLEIIKPEILEPDMEEELAEGDQPEKTEEELAAKKGQYTKPKGAFKITVVGRPNVGKSTLINKYLGENRVLAGPMAGLTRDSIALKWKYKDQDIELIDTAGMRKRAKVVNKIEKLSVSDGLRALQFAHAAILMLDATEPLERQDVNIANRVIDEGRILIIAINKWDLLNDAQRKEVLLDIDFKLSHVMAQAKGLPVIPVCAESGENINRLISKALSMYKLWNARISTAKLNRWLEMAEEQHPPPIIGRNRIRLKYMTQIKSRPPTFALFVSKPVELPDSYIGYLRNHLHKDFDLPGIPLRILIRAGKNPYAK